MTDAATPSAPSSTMTIGAVNFAAADPAALSEFWIAVLGGEAVGGDGHDYVYVSAAPGGVPLFFHRRDDNPSVPGRIHLDLSTEPGRREEQVGRMLELGATREWDVLDEVPWVEWTTMVDPEGNLFCVSCPRT
ncbi:VOC family protein [Gordonia rubripertincta]|uniref:VOC family protein n=1 Tax=Gordonia rubripertincta TaxID=36822 RepID=A0ABT4MT19_GORRU|nr:VOC family protein [Gordonia rubripertincta]MCZ4549820.1 VOC family protein [Gordonia rubripertincta]